MNVLDRIKPALSFKETEPPAEEPRRVAPKSAAEMTALLSDTERAVLAKRFIVSIPRSLTLDERNIIEKKVSLPADPIKTPVITTWTQEEFDALIEKEQTRRKIKLLHRLSQ